MNSQRHSVLIVKGLYVKLFLKMCPRIFLSYVCLISSSIAENLLVSPQEEPLSEGKLDELKRIAELNKILILFGLQG